MSAPAQTGTVDVHVDGVLGAEYHDARFFVGRRADTGATVSGYGRVDDRVVVAQPPRELTPVSSGLPVDQAALTVPVGHLRQLLVPLRPSESTLVLGGGPLAAITDLLVGDTARRQAAPTGSADLVIVDLDTGAGRTGPAEHAAGVADACARTADGGTVLVLCPPHADRIDFALYPDVHARSLRMLVRTVYAPLDAGDGTGSAPTAALAPLLPRVAGRLAAAGLVREHAVAPGGRPVSRSAGRFGGWTLTDLQHVDVSDAAHGDGSEVGR